MTNKPRNQRGHWQIKENVASVAAKCNAKVDFKNEYPGAYESAKKNRWIDEVCSHMVTPIPRNKKTFTYDECKNIAAKYNSRKVFERGDGAAYRFSKQHGWFEDICSHMTRPKPINVKWTFDKCKEEAAKYDTRIGFKSVCSGSAYHAARKNGWLEEICSHMEYKSSLIDVIYMWNTVENPDIWKIGVSNHYTVDKRIKNVLSQTEYTLHEVLWVQTENNAKLVETTLLALGQSVELDNVIDGKSEFRYLSEKDTQTAKKILKTNGTVRYDITNIKSLG